MPLFILILPIANKNIIFQACNSLQMVSIWSSLISTKVSLSDAISESRAQNSRQISSWPHSHKNKCLPLSSPEKLEQIFPTERIAHLLFNVGEEIEAWIKKQLTVRGKWRRHDPHNKKYRMMINWFQSSFPLLRSWREYSGSKV